MKMKRLNRFLRNQQPGGVPGSHTEPAGNGGPEDEAGPVNLQEGIQPHWGAAGTDGKSLV